MGSCISKCKPKKKFKEDYSHVQDKLIISQDPISSIPPKITTMPLQNLKPLSPAPTNSSTSFSSFSCSNNNTKFTITPSSSSTSTSTSTSSSCSSSLLSTKDRSFSNEFLWSCVKENQHLISLNPKAINEKCREKTITSANKIQYHQNIDPSLLLASHLVQMKPPKKRARANSPTLVRQKSFRKEQNSVSSTPNRALRSPSPSRRFNATNENNSCRRQIVSKGNNNVINAVNSNCPRRESLRASPSRDLTTNGRNFSVRKKDVTFCQQVSGKNIGDHVVGGGDFKDKQEMDVVMEDINNPLIALDCFIFL